MKQIMMFNMFMWFCIALVAIAAIYISKNPKWAFLLLIGPFSTLTTTHSTTTKQEEDK